LGLYFLRARFLDVQSGRFWTQDSWEGARSDPTSLHKYTYTGNNPINGIDPSGYLTVAESVTTLAIATGLGALFGATIAYALGGQPADIVRGAVEGATVSALIVTAVLSGAIWVAPALGISEAAFIVASGEALSLIFATLGVRDFLNARTKEEKIVAVFSVIMAVGGSRGGRPTPTPAQLYAEVFQSKLRGFPQKERPALVAVLETPDGNTMFPGHSSFRDPVHPNIQAILNEIPVNQRTRYHGRCGEIHCVSQAEHSGVPYKGGTISASEVFPFGSSNEYLNGVPKPPCDSCQYVLDRVQVQYVVPGQK
jgi:hypothetical protein